MRSTMIVLAVIVAVGVLALFLVRGALFRDDRISLIYQTWFEPMGAPPGDLLRAAVQLQALPE